MTLRKAPLVPKIVGSPKWAFAFVFLAFAVVFTFIAYKTGTGSRGASFVCCLLTWAGIAAGHSLSRVIWFGRPGWIPWIWRALLVALT